MTRTPLMFSDPSSSEADAPPLRHHRTTAGGRMAGVAPISRDLTDRRPSHPAGTLQPTLRPAGADELTGGLEFEWISRSEHEATVKRLEEKISVLAMQKDYWWHKSLGRPDRG